MENKALRALGRRGELFSVDIPEHQIFEEYPFIKGQLVRCWRLINKRLEKQGIVGEEGDFLGRKKRALTLAKGSDQLLISQILEDGKPYEIELTVARENVVTVIMVNYFTDEYNRMPGFTCGGINLPIGERGGVKDVVFQNWGLFEDATPYVKLVDWIEETLGYFLE